VAVAGLRHIGPRTLRSDGTTAHFAAVGLRPRGAAIWRPEADTWITQRWRLPPQRAFVMPSASGRTAKKCSRLRFWCGYGAGAMMTSVNANTAAIPTLLQKRDADGSAQPLPSGFVMVRQRP